MDSPGFSAKFCTYTMLNLETLDILCMHVVDKREVALKSPNMELKEFKDILSKLENEGLTVTEVVTDAHPSISAYMRKEQQEKKHTYDMWHGAKNLSKKLTAVASSKANRGLMEWRADIVNHFWHACKTCEGDEVSLRHKWTGLVHHVVDEHEWALGACEHGELEEQDKEYLEPGSAAHQSLTEVVFDDRFLRNLAYYENCRYPAYKARCHLAALDYQMHKDRPGEKTKAGDQIWHRSFNKNSCRWKAVAVKVDKEYLYMTDLLAETFKTRIEDTGSIRRRVTLMEDDPRRLSRTIAPIPPLPTAEIVASQITRRKQGAVRDES